MPADAQDQPKEDTGHDSDYDLEEEYDRWKVF